MADYYPLIARAVAGLDKNTGDARRALYERARAALVAQLRSVSPALSESDVTRERLALEEAVRKVEAESVRQAKLESRPASKGKVKAPEIPRWEPPRAPPAPPAPPAASAPPMTPAPPAEPAPTPAPTEEAPKARARRAGPLPPRTDPPPRAARMEKAPEPPPKASPGEEAGRRAPEISELPPAVAARPQRSPLRERPPGERQSLLDSVNAFRNVGPETGDSAESASRAPKWARRDHAEVPAPARGLDRATARRLDHVGSDELIEDASHAEMLEPVVGMDEASVAPNRARPVQFLSDEIQKRFETRARFVGLAVGLAIVAAIGGVLGWQWSNLSALYQSWRAPAPMEVAGTETPVSVPRNKIADRYEPGGANQSQQKAALTPSASEGPAVAQRVVLYEEDPADPQGKRFIGSAIWRTEKLSPAAGQPPELAIRADVEIPERQLAMTWSLRRNTDPTLPASHTVEITFKLPSNFASGGVSNVPGILMKEAEQSRGTPLAGLAVKVTNGFFLIGLSSADADKERNIALLKERSWFDIPVVYDNNRRAILALEKGTPGERVFAEAFAAWRQ